MSLGTTALRGTIGALFVGHGAQKLFGSFGGHGIEGTGQFFESLGLKPGERHAKAAGAAELAGGALLAAGALTPVASTLISSTMLTAINKAHRENGPWVTNGGWEYNAVLIAAATAIAEHGPGKLSVDAALFPNFKGAKWALLSLAAAIAGSAIAQSDLANQADGAKHEGEAGPGDPATADDRDRFTRDEAAESTATPSTQTTI